MLPRLWLLVGSDRPTDRQCHLLSCPGQLKSEFCQIEHLQILLVIGEKYFWFFATNPVEPFKFRAVGLLQVKIMLINHYYFVHPPISFYCFFSFPDPVCPSGPNLTGGIELFWQWRTIGTTGFATRIRSTSPQPPAGSVNAQLAKLIF